MALSKTLADRLKWLDVSCNGFATSHSCLQDWYHMWEFILTFSNVALGLFLLTLALADAKTIQPISESFPLPQQYDNETKVKVLMAMLSALSVFLSLVDFIMKPAARADSHKAAVDKYVRSKYAFRSIGEIDAAQEDKDVKERFEAELNKYLDRENVPTIPELLFPVLRLWQCVKTWVIVWIDKMRPY